MLDKGHWRNREIRHHVSVIDGNEKPTLLLKNATYLNMYTKSGCVQIYGLIMNVLFMWESVFQNRKMLKLLIVRASFYFQDMLSHMHIHIKFITRNSLLYM